MLRAVFKTGDGSGTLSGPHALSQFVGPSGLSSGLADGAGWCGLPDMARSNKGNHAFTGIFLVGLGIIAIFDFWWPGIMFVIALAMLVSAMIDGRLGENIIGIAILLALGVIGLWGKLRLDTGFPIWPVLFIAIGLAYLVKTFWKRPD
jgi:hypothetical protein